MIDRPIVIVGGGGHARVLYTALIELGCSVLGFLDRESEDSALIKSGVKYLGVDADISRFSTEEICLVNGLGSVKDTRPRSNIFNHFKQLGFNFAQVIHPTAIIARDCEIGEGAQIMAGAIVQTGTTIGMNSIINTRASVDHDCRIGDHAHIGPGAVLCGQVALGSGVHIGSGATIIQCIKIGLYSVIGAGAVVLENVDEKAIVAGVPAKQLRKNQIS